MAEQPPRDGLKRSLSQALDHDRKRRDRRGKPTQATKPKRETSKQSIIGSAVDRTMVNQTVSRQQQRHGCYQAVDFKLLEVTEGGRRKEKTIRVVRNLGRTPIDRWIANGHLDERQAAAILFYQEAFRKVFGEGPRVTASYSPAVVRGYRGSVELWAASGLAAKESLRLLDQEVFFRLPIDYFPVWQNVVIWDEPAGVAGSRAGFLHKPAEAAARLIVTTVAKMIADIVIDSSRKDFGDILLDIDAPRRPGRRG